MSPHWYDLLNVSRTASADEIRTAWKSSIADLDPSDRRFRVLNEAAGILLDPERRAAYDATLASEEQEEDEEREGDPVPDTAPEPMAVDVRSEHEPAPGRGFLRLALLGLLVVVTLGVVVATIFAWTRPGAIDESPAQSAAEVAVVPVLSYDYRTLDADAEAAKSYMTPEFQESYDDTFTLLEENAGRTETVVSVESVVASGIVRSGKDRVDVLLFVNRARSNVQRTDVFRDQVTMQMVLLDGQWLVDKLITTPAAA